MFARLLLLFALIPIIELLILIKIGSYLGALNTVLLVIAMAFLGVALARYQGIGILMRIRQSLSEGIMPAEELLNGLIIIIAGVFLITPGILTDAFGFLLLIPYTRNWFKGWMKEKMQYWIHHRGGGPSNNL